ncbi:hypothetical protein RHODO2019_09255 [Rhodococcus antarcticus]|jgi:hypothetical protein|uniref:Uncharacterized protein n=1 Tax=Rhodococcus antarcticus TaxID=2987751 RepID=A0ABY6NVL0_9NOCA|nr:hypothetical protein [Rhodococcus antarcticus]UZJ23427.1 hypothetical protein RHODO2019_09255 [Rhodococcus antarcticus]
MSLSTIDLVRPTTRHGRSAAPTTRRRLRNARRALSLVAQDGTVPAPRDHGVRLHPVELGPWDD